MGAVPIVPPVSGDVDTVLPSHISDRLNSSDFFVAEPFLENRQFSQFS